MAVLIGSRAGGTAHRERRSVLTPQARLVGIAYAELSTLEPAARVFRVVMEMDFRALQFAAATFKTKHSEKPAIAIRDVTVPITHANAFVSVLYDPAVACLTAAKFRFRPETLGIVLGDTHNFARFAGAVACYRDTQPRPQKR